ncbi:MAG: VCBS repeat-containing protein [Tepidisphaeraceae bacterium]|jgi:hypothetical protein
MKKMNRLVKFAFGLALAGASLFWPRESIAYVEAPYSVGRIILESTNIVLVKVEKIDNERNLIIYRKVKDLKGVHPTELIKHNIGKAGFQPREWQYSMAAVAPGKFALFFHNGSAAETCVENYWYQTYAGGEWWNMSHGEPYLMRSFYGKPEKLADLVTQMLAGKEVVTVGMVDGDKNAIQIRQARLQRMKASMKIQDYDPKRDFLGWGGDEFRRVTGMPAFMLYGAVTRTDPGAWGATAADVNGTGQQSLLLYGEDKTALLVPNANGNSMDEATLPYTGGARAACFADFNGDGKPDILLATPTGPKLLINLGGGQWRDDSAVLPQEPYWNLTGAAVADFDGDGKPDILLANGFLGLRMYRNIMGSPAAVAGPTPAAPVISKWQYIGPFDNADGIQGFDIAYPPETEIDLKKTYPGKGGEVCAWKEGKFADGQVNEMTGLFKPEHRTRAVVYLYRELDYGQTPVNLPVSLGSDDTLTVWLNGERIVSDKVSRSCAPDQATPTLKLRPGRNKLLIKVCQGDGQWAFYYAAKPPQAMPVKQFEDVSVAVGLGPTGLGSNVKGDRLLVADFNGDGRPDVIYCAGNGMLLLNTPQGFVESKDHGLNFKPGHIAPAIGDFMGDKTMGLFVPQAGGCKLYRNDGKGHFADVTAQSGDLAKFNGNATSAVFTNFFGTGRLDLIVGCIRGYNRIYRNNGNGTFTDATDEAGLSQKVFNTRGIAAFDMNKDGVVDLAFNNEGQESCVLVGSPTRVKK